MSTIVILNQIVARLSQADRMNSFHERAQSWDIPECRRRTALLKPMDRKESKDVLAYLQKTFVPPIYFEQLLSKFPTPESAQRATTIWLTTTFRDFQVQMHRYSQVENITAPVWTNIVEMLHKNRVHIPYWSPSPSNFNAWVDLASNNTPASRSLAGALHQLSPIQVEHQINGWLDKLASFINTRSASGPYQQSKNGARDLHMFRSYLLKEQSFFDVFTPPQCARFKELMDNACQSDVGVIQKVLTSEHKILEAVFARATQHVLDQEVGSSGVSSSSKKKM